MSLVHASAVRVGEHGVLIRGPSGAGKSSLLLGLLTLFRGTSTLVADDRVILTPQGGELIAAVPENLAGLMEVRGQGIVRRPYVSPARLHLVVDLRPFAECPRLPGPGDEAASVEGVALPRLILPIGAVDGAARVGVALERLAP